MSLQDDRPMLTAFADLAPAAQREHLREHHRDDQADTYGPTARTAAHGADERRLGELADHIHA